MSLLEQMYINIEQDIEQALHNRYSIYYPLFWLTHSRKLPIRVTNMFPIQVTLSSMGFRIIFYTD